MPRGTSSFRGKARKLPRPRLLLRGASRFASDPDFMKSANDTASRDRPGNGLAPCRNALTRRLAREGNSTAPAWAGCLARERWPACWPTWPPTGPTGLVSAGVDLRLSLCECWPSSNTLQVLDKGRHCSPNGRAPGPARALQPVRCKQPAGRRQPGQGPRARDVARAVPLLQEARYLRGTYSDFVLRVKQVQGYEERSV